MKNLKNYRGYTFCILLTCVVFVECNRKKTLSTEPKRSNIVTLITDSAMVRIHDNRNGFSKTYSKPLSEKEVGEVLMHLNKFFDTEKVLIDIRGGVNDSLCVGNAR